MRAVRFLRFLRTWMRDDPARFVAVVSGRLPSRLATLLAGVLRRTRLGTRLPTAWYLLARRAGLEPPSLAHLVTRCSVRARCRLAIVLAALEEPDAAAAALPSGDASSLRVRTARAEVLLRAGEITAAAAQLRTTDQGRRARRVRERCAGELGILLPRATTPLDDRPTRAVAPLPRRVLHLVTNALPYVRAGYTIRTQQIAAAQAADGLEPHVVTAWGWPHLQGFVGAEPYAEIEGVPHHRLLPTGPVPARTDRRVEHGIEATTDLAVRLRPAVLHAATNYRNGVVAAAVRDRTGIPMIYEVRGFLEDTWAFRNGERAPASERYRLERQRETLVMRAADAVVTLSETMREELVSRGVNADRIRLAPNAVPARLLSRQFDKVELRGRFGFAEDALLIGAAATLNAYEGYDVLLEALVRLREDARTVVHLLLAGDGPERPRLRRLVSELGLEGQVRFTGRLTGEDALLAQAVLDVFVAPRRDARVCRLVAPLKPIEAMALGVPLVLSDLPALAELAATGAGVCVPPGDPYALAKTLADLLDDPGRRCDLGAAGRQAVAERHTWEYLTKTYRDLYAQMTDSSPSLP